MSHLHLIIDMTGLQSSWPKMFLGNGNVVNYFDCIVKIVSHPKKVNSEFCKIHIF